MSIHRFPPDPQTPTGPSADAAYYRQVLHQLIDMGVDLARIVHSQALAEPPLAPPLAPEPAPRPAPDATIPFDRIARTIRRTITLARRVAEPLPAATANNPASHRDATRRRIIRGVEDAIQRHAEATASTGQTEALHQEFLDRLDGPDLNEHLDDDSEHLPVTEIIADICRDLGLATPPGLHPWKRRTPGDIAALCARAAQRPGPQPDQPPEDLRNLTRTVRIQPAAPPGTVHALPNRTRPSSDPPPNPASPANAAPPQSPTGARET